MSRNDPPVLASHDPSTGALLWQGPHGDVDAAVRAARAAFPAWATAPLDARLAIITRYRDLVRERAAPFAELIARETGKPLWDAQGEVASVAAKVDISIEAYHARTGTRVTEIAAGRQALRHKPHGVLAVLGPYNFPAHLPNGHIVPALIAGDTIVFKPSEQTPAVAEHMAALWRDAGLPPGVLNLVQGAANEGRALASHAGIDGLLFTGSATTGFALHEAFAGAPHKLLALEMGGNNPLIVWDVDPADTEAAAAIVIQSAYMSSGQRCTCARRLIVHESAAPRLIEVVAALIDRVIVDQPFADPAPFMGPVIDMRAAARLEDAAQAMTRSGARVIRPMRRLHDARPFVSPALIDTTGHPASDEEHFGPLLQLIRVRDFDEALAQANATSFGLSASLVGGDAALYGRFWTGIRAGIVNWNRPTSGAASNAPFGGIGHSGNHRPAAYYAADYCAYPVASVETDRPEATIAIGLKA